jgi:hypothetical protein
VYNTAKGIFTKARRQERVWPVCSWTKTRDMTLRAFQRETDLRLASATIDVHFNIDDG